MITPFWFSPSCIVLLNLPLCLRIMLSRLLFFFFFCYSILTYAFLLFFDTVSFSFSQWYWILVNVGQSKFISFCTLVILILKMNNLLFCFYINYYLTHSKYNHLLYLLYCPLSKWSMIFLFIYLFPSRLLISMCIFK